ncbi:MAG: glycosyltransferase family 2 protein, partial [Anaerolineales bacterium]|nr:glycosyltransferase family 2 protein [Anaerolineales bacterium]
MNTWPSAENTTRSAAQPQHKLSVIIPAYNEEDGIAEIVERVLAIEPELKKVGVDALELIVVDDGSKDRTADIVRGYSAVRLIQHQVNRNYGGALKTGFRHATGDLLAFLDADSTYPPEYFPQMCKVVLDGADMCVGSRMAGEKNDSPKIRQIGNFLFAQLVSLISNTRVTDVASGQRVFRRDVLPLLYPLP